MKITILTYLEKEDDTKVDEVVEQVGEALKAHGHTVSILGVHGDVRKLILGLARRKPDLVFNLMEMFGDNLQGDVCVAGMLDLIGVPHTCSRTRRWPRSCWPTRASSTRSTPSSVRATTPRSRPAATCTCRCS
jgi:hypothetical protein